MNKNTFYTFSLGCKVNSYECSALASELIRRGYKEDKIDPEVVIINTCSVTSTADQKSRQHIRKFINNFKDAIIVAMGCYVQGHADFVRNEIKPNIIVGTSNRNKIPDYIEQFKKDGIQICDVDKNTRAFTYEELGTTSDSENIRAYLKVGDGCDNFCSYCLIPYRRGALRSRSLINIVKEAEYLIKQGYKEIVLTGIHVGGYGKDFKDGSFSTLVETLLDIPGLYSLRISSIEESEIDEKLIELINTKDNLAKHLHIPLQSGCDETLKRMHRKYTCEQFFNKIQNLKKACPNVAITTDVITGFCGETEEEFAETKQFIKKCGFHMLHVFPFSLREGTLAATMKDQVDEKIKKDRCRDLIKLSKELYEEYATSFVGQELNVLVERYDSVKKVNIGHTSNYLEIAIPSIEERVGEVINVILTKDMIVSQ